MTGRTPARVDPEIVAQLAADGMGRNAVARTLGVSRRAVDTAAKAAGITWVRSSTEAATKARMADRRAELLDDFSEISDKAAERLLDALDADEIDPRVLQALAQVAGAATDKLTTLADRLTATDDHGDSLLDRLAAGFSEWAEHVANADDQITTTSTTDPEGTSHDQDPARN